MYDNKLNRHPNHSDRFTQAVCTTWCSPRCCLSPSLDLSSIRINLRLHPTERRRHHLQRMARHHPLLPVQLLRYTRLRPRLRTRTPLRPRQRTPTPRRSRFTDLRRRTGSRIARLTTRRCRSTSARSTPTRCATLRSRRRAKTSRIKLATWLSPRSRNGHASTSRR